MEADMLRCSFCRRPDAEVMKLVAGPVRLFSRRVYICDRCAVEANRIMDSHSGEPQARVNSHSLLTRTLVRLASWRHWPVMAVTG
jgi:protein-arginine kinase activator protein McsA